MNKLLLITFCVVGLSCAAQSSFESGLVVHYSFNGNANDGTTNGNHGLVNGATLGIDRFGSANSAYWFDGTGSHIVSTLPITLAGNSPRTISLWLYATTNASGQLVYWGNEVSTSQLCGLIVGEAKNVIFQGDFKDADGGGDIETNRWHHLAFVYSTNLQSSRFYLDGVEKVPVTAGGTLNTASGTYLSVGRNLNRAVNLNDGWGIPWSGAIDDVRIYNRALSTNEIARLFEFESVLTINVKRAVYVDSQRLQVGSNYQLQVSSDTTTWTNYGAPFIATNAVWRGTNYFDVDNWGSLFFRLKIQ